VLATPARLSRSSELSSKLTFALPIPARSSPMTILGEILRKIRVGGDQHPAHDSYQSLERESTIILLTITNGEDPRGAAEPPLDQTGASRLRKHDSEVVNAPTDLVSLQVAPASPALP